MKEHMFIAVRKTGKTKFVDSQIGKEVDINKVLLRAKVEKHK